MVHVLVRHKVKDYQSWKRVFDDFLDTRASGGELKWWISRMTDDPNNLMLYFDWDNADNARKFFDSPQLKAAMEQAGVADRPDVYFLEDVARGETRKATAMR